MIRLIKGTVKYIDNALTNLIDPLGKKQEKEWAELMKKAEKLDLPPVDERLKNIVEWM